MSIDNYKDLIVWQTSRVLVKDIYELCANLPMDEKYGMSSQLKRAAVSIPSNIAEGYRRNNRKEYVQFLGIAAGSAAEVETQLILVNDIFGIDTTNMIGKITEVQKMLRAISNKLSPKP